MLMLKTATVLEAISKRRRTARPVAHTGLSKNTIFAATHSAEDALVLLDAPANGLTAEQATDRLNAVGPNTIEATTKTLARRIADAFIDPFAGILAALALVSLYIDVLAVPEPQRDPSTVIIIGIIVVFFGYNFIGQYFFTNKPDYNVAVVAPYYLPDDTVTALQEQLAQYGEDLNGDGKTVVTLNVYTLDYSAGDTQTESDAYLTMAGTTKLATDVAGGLSSVFLLYDPAGFQESTGSLRYLDGTLPEAGSDSDWWNMVYRWTDCPVLTGMELGSYTSDAVQSASGDSQQLLADYYIGIRGAWLKESASLLENSEPLWANLTAGAVSTAGEGH